MFKKLLLIGMLVWVSPAWAEVRIFGGISCGKWIEERQVNEWGALVFQSWVNGYLSGLSTGVGISLLANTDALSVHLWIDNYCREHPLDGLADASAALANELITRMPKKK